MTCDRNPERALLDTLRWLSAQSPMQPNLTQLDLASHLDQLVDRRVFPLLNSYYLFGESQPPNAVSELCAPQDVIDAYTLRL